MITVFENLYSEKSYNVSVDQILKRFKTEDRNNIIHIQSLPKEERDKKKKFLPVACFGGVFNIRKSEQLKEASGYLILDFDDVENDSSLIESLQSWKHTYSFWKSPSGKGYKALIKIKKVKNDAEYKIYYNYCLDYFKDHNPDTATKDISRACFFCYDPNLWINENCKELTGLKQTEKKKVNQAKIDNVRNNYSILNKACEIIRHAQVGERHNKILSASRLIGGYVANGIISYSEAERILLQEADKINDDINDNQKAVTDGLNNGMESPLDVQTLNKELKEHESVIKHGKIYYTLQDKKEQLNEFYKKGNTRGYLTGHKELDEHYSVKLGTTTYVYGAPHHGKTQIWFEILICLSIKNGLRHAIFSPETGDATEIFAELVSMVAGGDFTNTYKNQISVKDRDKAYDFVDRHFIVIDPSHEILTHTDFFNYLNEIERVYNCKIHTATIDPFNEFHQDLSKFSNRQDLYLESVLREVRENARTNERHNCIITHVQDQQPTNYPNTNIQYVPQPTYRQIAGGQAWSRRGMSMLSVWRPSQNLIDNTDDYRENTTVVEIQKSKPKGIGQLGKVNFIYDVKTHRYTDYNNNKPEFVREESQVEMKYNNNFDSYDYGNSFEQNGLEDFEPGNAKDAPF